MLVRCRQVKENEAAAGCAAPFLPQVLLALLVRDYTVTLTDGSDQSTWVPCVLDGMKRKDGGMMLLEFRKDTPGAAEALNA